MNHLSIKRKFKFEFDADNFGKLFESRNRNYNDNINGEDAVPSGMRGGAFAPPSNEDDPRRNGGQSSRPQKNNEKPNKPDEDDEINHKSYEKYKEELEEHGLNSIKKGYRKHKRTLAQHEKDTPGYEYKSFNEATMRNIRTQIKTIEKLFRDLGFEL